MLQLSYRVRVFIFSQIVMEFKKFLLLVAGLMFLPYTCLAYQFATDGKFLYGDRLLVEDAYLFRELSCLPDRFWVNLSPSISPDQVLPGLLWAGEVGRILLEADIKLKESAQRLIEERLDWDEDVLFRVLIFVRSVRVGIYENGKAVEWMRLGVRFYSPNKDWEERFNRVIGPLLEEEVNSSAQFSDLRRVIGLYALSRGGSCRPLDRVFMGQEWNDKPGALETYEEMFEEGLVGGVVVDEENFHETQYPGQVFPTDGRSKVPLSTDLFEGHKEVLFQAKEEAKRLLAVLRRPFLPEERLLRDLMRVGIVEKDEVKFPEEKEEGIYEFSFSKVEEVMPGLRIPVEKIWREARSRYWELMRRRLRERVGEAVRTIDPEGRYVWSVEGGIRGGKVYIYQVRPEGEAKGTKFDVNRFVVEIPEVLKRGMMVLAQEVGLEQMQWETIIKRIDEGRLKEGVDLFLGGLFVYASKRDVVKTLVEKLSRGLKGEERYFGDAIFLFATEGGHYPLSILADVIVEKKGAKYLAERMKEVVQVVDELGVEGIERLGGYKFGVVKDESREQGGDEVLFGVGGMMIFWASELSLKIPGAKKRFLSYLSEMDGQTLRPIVEEANRFVGMGNDYFLSLMDDEVKQAVERIGIKTEVQGQVEQAKEGKGREIKTFSGAVLAKGNLGDRVVGKVKVGLAPDEVKEVKDGDVLIVKDLPTNYPEMEGLPSCIIVLGKVVRGQHATLYARQMGVPLVEVEGADLEDFGGMEGKAVEVDLLEGKVSLSSGATYKDFLDKVLLPYKKKLVEQVKRSLSRVIKRGGFSPEVAIGDLASVLSEEEFGVKVSRLSHLMRAGVDVPEGVAVSLGLLQWVLDRIDFDREAWKEAFRSSVERGRMNEELKCLSREIREGIRRVGLGELLDRLWDGLGDLQNRELIVRSASSIEDREDVPFVGTGVLDSIRLKEVSKRELAQAIREVLASMFSPESVGEKVKFGIDPTRVGMGIVVQEAIVEDVGFVGTVEGEDMEFDVVLGNNSVITAQGKAMGNDMAFSLTGKFVFNPPVPKRKRLESMFSGEDANVKVMRFWREGMVCLGNWNSEDARLYWAELWNQVALVGDEEVTSLITKDYQELFKVVLREWKRMNLEDRLLLYYLPYVVLYREVPPMFPSLGDLLKGNLPSSGISALQVISRVRPDWASLEEVRSAVEETEGRQRRLGINLIWYVSDPIGVVRGVSLGEERSKEVGGIEVYE